MKVSIGECLTTAFKHWHNSVKKKCDLLLLSVRFFGIHVQAAATEKLCLEHITTNLFPSDNLYIFKA